jgi:chromosome condensin MukBEF ATPase and DNA-binding subunit MukB
MSQAENEEVKMIELPEEEVIQMLLSGMCAQQEYIEKLQEEVSDLNQQFCKIAQILAGHQQRYESFNEYIHSYIDLPVMVKLVNDIAAEVDIDVTDYYPSPTIQ